MMGVAFSCESTITSAIQEVYLTVPYFILVNGITKVGVGIGILKVSQIFPLLRDKSIRIWLILCGLVHGGIVTLILISIVLLSLVDALALFYLNPIPSSVIGRIAFKDPFGWRSILSLLISLAGVCVLIQPDLLVGSESIVWTVSRKFGLLSGISSAVLGAVTMNFARWLGSRADAPVIALWAYIAQIMYVTPILFVFPIFPDGETKRWIMVLPAIASGVFGSLRETLMCRSCSLVQAGFVGTLESTQLLWSALWSWLFLGETIPWYLCLGAILMILGVVGVSWESLRFESSKVIASSANMYPTPEVSLE